MNRKALIIISLQAVVIVVLAWMLVFYGKDEYEAYQRRDDEEIKTASHVAAEKGASVVSLSAEAQQASGIAVEALHSASHQAQLTSYGSVIGIEPLVELRTRYLAARAEAGAVRASIASTQQDYQRLQALNRDNRNVSDRAVQAAEAAWKADEARLAAAETQAGGIRDSMRQQWGDALARWAVGEQGSALAKLLSHEEVLIQAALPFDGLQAEKIAAIEVAPAGSHGKPVAAVYVSPSPQTDATLQGRTYFFRAPASELRAGMRVEAHIRAQGKQAAGVVIPNAAVVWYAGKAWAYRKEDTDKFVRVPVDTSQEAGDGWFAASGFTEGDELVVSGTQLLLSEELKYQIKNENED
ncbi:MAG TPA: hypothetical protein VGK14_01640 [Novimethylophilus sp.]|uniref:efflux RND transporter periplasmic adaptor subunit n=1 Tax=Novimethylophilus sp. TaxID=2137426 RepID=UPI002F4170AF